MVSCPVSPDEFPASEYNAAETRTAQPPQKLNALEEAKLVNKDSPRPIRNLMISILNAIPGVGSTFGLKKPKINYKPRNLYFNMPIPSDEIDSKTGQPKAKYASNKIRTTKYTPLNFLPKNIIFQFQNVANIYFLMVAIFAAFSIFGTSNPGLAAVPIIAIVIITALRDAAEDWRRMVLDLDLNNTVTTILHNVPNENSPSGNVDIWRRFKKACTRFYRRMWFYLRRKEDLSKLDSRDINENQSVLSEEFVGLERRQTARNSVDGQGHNTVKEINVGDRDLESNEKPVFLRKYWKDVRVGDFVKVYADQGVPADMIIFSSSDPEGDCFIDTRNLDGESSLKGKLALKATKGLRRGWQIKERKFKVEVEGTNSDLSSFGWRFIDTDSGETEAIGPANFLPRGSTVRNSRWVIGYVVYTGIESKIILNAGETPSKRSRLARDLNVYVTCSFVFLFSMCFVAGVVEGCKFRNKNNFAYYFEEGLMTKNAALNGFVTFFASMLILQNLVPISLYISVEIARTCFAFFIYSDCWIYDEDTDYPCTPKSWALSDDLGQIEFIFSDKTGTLTQNSMLFRKCTINGVPYGIAFTESMAGQVIRRNEDLDLIKSQMEDRIESERKEMQTKLDALYRNPYATAQPELVSARIIDDINGNSGTKQKQHIEQFALVLALCNTVVTEVKQVSNDMDNTNNDANRSMTSLAVAAADKLVSPQISKRKHSLELPTSQVIGGSFDGGRRSVSSARPRKSLDYRHMSNKVLMHKAESPDESTLVKMARDLGYTLVENGKHHKVIDMQGQFHKFDILQTLLFSSKRKRMSTIVRNEANRYFILTKGADSMIATLLSSESRNSKTLKVTEKHLEEYGDEGLRTLMIAYKELDPKFAEDWSRRYTEAASRPDREEALTDLATEVENNLVLLGGTGIEDQLQEDVPHTIETLGKAGIKLWMLTGDKVETAISIGFSCNLLNTQMELLIVKSPEELSERLRDMGLEVNKKTLAEAGNDHRPAHSKYGLVIDGNVLSTLVSNEDYRLQFALLGKKCKSVLCCRVSPSQKAAVVYIMKSTFDVTTIAIGDGANDVSMIQVADVGVGIVGVEGRQAAMSADFAIGQFRFLQRLLLVHGRWSYMRVASMIETLIFENFMFTLTLFFYNIFTQMDQSYLYDYTYLTLFNSVFVSLPVVFRGILDQDLPDFVLLKFPELYGHGILRNAWTVKKYFFTVADGIYQSAVAFFFVYSIFFTGKFYTMDGMDIAYRQGMGVLAVTTSVFVCNTFVLLGQYRWDWISFLIYVVSCLFVFTWTGIYSSVVTSNFFYKSASVVYDTLTFWAYLLVSFVAALLPRFAYNTVSRIWFPSDVDIIREQWRSNQLQFEDPAATNPISNGTSESSENEK